MELAMNVADLRRQATLFHKKLPQGIDLNDWTNYLLSGFRAQRVRLSRMDPKEQMTLGPCKVLTWQVEMDGDFESLSKVVEWLENGERLIRLDRVVLQGANGHLTLSMLLKGLALDVPLEKLRAEKEKADLDAAKAAKKEAAKLEKSRLEKQTKWTDEKPMAIPEGFQLPGNVKLPQEVLDAANEGKSK
jgi:Tfp pilus assembly protein PilO